MKKQQFKISLPSGTFVTLDGISDDDMGVISKRNNGKNLMEFPKAKMDTVCNSVFRNLSLDGLGNLPELTVTKSEVVDDCYIIEGTASVNGKDVTVKIDKSGVTIEPLDATTEVVEEVPEVVEPVVNEVKVEDPSPTNETFMTAPVEEPVPEPITVKEQIPEPEPVKVEEVPVMITESGETFMNEPVVEEHVNPGVSFNRKKDLESVSKKTCAALGTPRRVKGFTLNGVMPDPNSPKNYRYRPLRNLYVADRPMHTVFVQAQPEPVPVPVATPVPVPVQEERNNMVQQLTENTQWSAAPITEEPVVVEEPIKVKEEKKDDYKAAKEAVRAKMSPEVNAVIGNIPHSMLGTINPFTTNPVDKDALEKMQDIYCIDNRWMNAGNWYCVDVVRESARYFFNSKLGVSIQIDLKTLKQWKEVVA